MAEKLKTFLIEDGVEIGREYRDSFRFFCPQDYSELPCDVVPLFAHNTGRRVIKDINQLTLEFSRETLKPLPVGGSGGSPSAPGAGGIQGASTISNNVDFDHYTHHIVFKIRCAVCKQESILIFFSEKEEYKVVSIFPEGNFADKKNIPPEVGYYITQAERSRSVGANSAALVMYRSAVEHILWQNGYDSSSGKLLGERIGKLKRDMENDLIPRWAKRIEIDYLDIIAKLGNAAVHTNGGDISKQEALDISLVIEVQCAISHIIEEVYEYPAKNAKRKDRLSSAIPPRRN